MKRTAFQGVANIIRFNWPFYAVSVASVLAALVIVYYATGPFNIVAGVLLAMIILPIAVSLLVSWYVYDLSNLYSLDWLEGVSPHGNGSIVNVNAGFDETSGLLAERFGNAKMVVCDFYDPERHTAPSIKRARQAYPPYPNTQKVSTNALPLEDGSADNVFAILSAHEIRDDDERTSFFKEVDRILTPNGRVVVVEHTREAANYLAYNVGALHFYSRLSWLRNFEAARLQLDREVKITPFITAFFLSKNGTAS